MSGRRVLFHRKELMPELKNHLALTRDMRKNITINHGQRRERERESVSTRTNKQKMFEHWQYQR